MQPPWFLLLLLGIVAFVASADKNDTANGGGGGEEPKKKQLAWSESELEEFFRAGLELVRPEMKTGNKQLGIEVMDPLALPDYRFERPSDLMEVLAVFTHIQLPRLSAFRLDNVSAEGLRVRLAFSFPSLSGVGDYRFQTKTFGVPVVSVTDRFEMLVTDIEATGLVQLARDPAAPGLLSCRSVDLRSTEKKVEITMVNLANDGLLRNLLDPRQVYKDYKPRIHAKIADAFRRMLDFAFKIYYDAV